MKLVQTTIIAGLAFFLSTGISFAVEMDDIELTIRVVETDDIEEIHNEISLPSAASDTAREHTEDKHGRGRNHSNEDGERGHSTREHENHENDVQDEERDEHTGHHDERDEDHDGREDEYHEGQEDEDHEEEHKNESDD